MMPSGIPPTAEHHGAAPLVGIPSAESPPGDTSADGRKAKRELSQSKRAAQNRAAQRAFRQRKEGYIKKLEQQVRDYGEMEQQFKALQTENYSLREYIVHLQSRLIDAQVEPPQPPPNINLSASIPSPMHGLPQQPPPAQDGAPPAEPTPNTGTAAGTAALDAVAQAVQSLSRSEASSFKTEPTAAESQAAEDARTAEEISRQLAQAGEGVPAANM
ncbi:hypothetical protein SLS53_004204 [Cytospora paraplurivora]|uniref:Putative transcription factor kapC n=1 Tax=Cytospora paraplurivora TaxID=2898453 RepID=A0AAN9YHF1_9PEZI